MPLVAEPVEEAGGAAEFIPLVEVTDAAAFALAISRLEEAGISWFVQSEPPLGIPSEPRGPVAVIYVAENRLEPARRAVETVLIGAGVRG
ncbi:MAG TPA: hypothetical protein VGG03_24560 [Thermoanaerobaculia bacterium]